MLLPVVRALLIQHDQLVGRRDRQLAQQDLVDQREDRGVGADAERQRENRDRREQGAAPKPAQREAQIGQRGLMLLGRMGMGDGCQVEACFIQSLAVWCPSGNVSRRKSGRISRAPLSAIIQSTGCSHRPIAAKPIEPAAVAEAVARVARKAQYSGRT